MLSIRARAELGATTLDVDLAVPAGRCLALAGPSGAGKTSVLRVVAGLLRPEGARVVCGDEDWTARAPEDRAVGYLFQEYALFGHLRAWENVAYPLRDVPRRARRARAIELLDRFGLAGLADARPRTLSGGERQRVALARALARRPKALLLDEPLSALDASTRRDAARALARVLADAQVPAILVTHDFAEAAELGDEVGVMTSGRVVQRGTASEVAAAPASGFVARFAGAVVLTGTATAGPDGLTDVALDGGGELTSTDPATGPVAASVFPWEITLSPGETRGLTPDRPPGVRPRPSRGEARGPAPGSARNELSATVVRTTTLGNRVRVALDGPQPLVAEVTAAAAEQLGLAPGARVRATFKATATRLTAR